MARKASGSVSPALQKAIAEELKEVTRKEPGDDGKDKFVYGTVERMRVIDRALKLEALKQRADDPEWGKEFEK